MKILHHWRRMKNGEPILIEIILCNKKDNWILRIPLIWNILKVLIWK